MRSSSLVPLPTMRAPLAAIVLAAAAVTSAATVARAQPPDDDPYVPAWVPLGNTGTFHCYYAVARIGSCEASGNTMVLRRDDGSLTLTYTGVTGGVLTDRIGVRVPVGTITAVLDGPFTSPDPLRFRLTFQTAHPYPIRMHFASLGDYPLPTEGVFWHLGQGNTLSLTDPRLDRPLSGRSEQVTVTMFAVVAPEPTSVALLATGVAVLGAGAARRRRQPRA